MSHPNYFLKVVILINDIYIILKPSCTEAYIHHHLLHQSARKLLEMSEINGLSEIILRFLEEKMRYDRNFYFFCQYFVDKLLKEIACKFYFHACKLIISF